jgi:subtilisin family serine protease
MRTALNNGRASGVVRGLFLVLGCVLLLAAAFAARAEAAATVPGVRHVEPAYVYHGSKLPDDPLIGRQWELASGASMRAPQAWDRLVGGPVTVAVIDSGIDLTHPDLAANLWTNQREVAGNGVDDDRNGYVDDVHGYDFVAGDGDPADELGHGTEVAGVIGARGGNGLGIAGVAWRARIMALRVLDSRDRASTPDIAAAIRYAVANGARIINVSLNGDAKSAAVEDAIVAAQAAGVLVVASAGNDARDLDSTPSYPASYGEDNVIVVGSSGRRGTISGFSNRGARAVDILAPGEDILSTDRNGEYSVSSGTSMAAPHVTGALALLASARPGLSGARLRAALLAGAQPASTRAGGRRLDVAAALKTAAAKNSRISRSKAASRR